MKIIPAVLLSLAASVFPAVATDPGDGKEVLDSLEKLEAQHGGRLGVAMAQIGNPRRELSYRGDERFAMCSTFKVLLAAAVAARVDAERESWERQIEYGKKDLIPWAPVTEKEENLAKGALPVEALTEAAMIWSDNTAANLMLSTVGGPEGLTRFLREHGDPTTRLDRTEPELNANLPGDPRDTSTPEAMRGSLESILFGDVLTKASQEKIRAWMVDNRTGDKRLRAGLPKDWRIGDKTGTNDNGMANDVAVAWPGAGEPVLVVVFYHAPDATAEQRDGVIAEVGRITRTWVDP